MRAAGGGAARRPRHEPRAERAVGGVLVVAPVSLRPDGTGDVHITADGAIERGVLSIPVGASPHYQFEIRLPAGVIFEERPDLTDAETGSSIPVGRDPPVIPWTEVHGSLLAGYAPHQDRQARWRLRLVGDPQDRLPLDRLPPLLRGPADRLVGRLPVDRRRLPPTSIRSDPFLPTRVRIIAWLTAAMFVAGAVARSLRVVPLEGVASALLVALPSAYAILLLQTSDVRSREVVAERPRTWLVLITLVTFLGAADLAVRVPVDVPFLDRWSVGMRAILWGVLTVASVAVARHVGRASRSAW
ncbi:MAG TPA: hypothetical protein VFO60_04895 [Candidatus Dormibacteraeota bacterium]|nr:hypothetical protein [Candidatus Dormibacteraeota bacterium]